MIFTTFDSPHSYFDSKTSYANCDPIERAIPVKASVLNASTVYCRLSLCFIFVFVSLTNYE